jgi:hypothetical protein
VVRAASEIRCSALYRSLYDEFDGLLELKIITKSERINRCCNE